MTDLSALNLCYFMPPNTPFICDEREFFTNLDFEQLSSHALYCYVKTIIIRRYSSAPCGDRKICSSDFSEICRNVALWLS